MYTLPMNQKLCGSNFWMYATIAILAFGLGTVSDRLIFDHHKDRHSRQVRDTGAIATGEYHLINPLLECEVADGLLDSYKENFKEDVVEVIDAINSRKDAHTVAVYFRDLNNGPTFGINDDMDFIPASLLKVPVMMSYYKMSEEDSALLDKKMTLEKEYEFGESNTQIIRPFEEIKIGESYTNREIIERMIRYSDNQAVSLLIENLQGKPIRQLYNMLGVREDVLNGPGGQLTVKEYAAFFRILFNSSYLSRNNSEKALDLLTRTVFDQGLKAGVPPYVTVAHKFGEGGTDTEHQIHDCGIIYYPDHPYLLCVMTRGDDIVKLEKAIATISGEVYAKIDYLYRDKGNKGAP